MPIFRMNINNKKLNSGGTICICLKKNQLIDVWCQFFVLIWITQNFVPIFAFRNIDRFRLHFIEPFQWRPSISFQWEHKQEVLHKPKFSISLTHQPFRDANSLCKVPKNQGHENRLTYKGLHTTNRTNRANSSFLIFGKEKGRRNRDEFFIAISWIMHKVSVIIKAVEILFKPRSTLPLPSNKYRCVSKPHINHSSIWLKNSTKLKYFHGNWIKFQGR